MPFFEAPPLVFPKPAIIRPATDDLLRYGRDPVAAGMMAHRMRRAAGNSAGPASLSYVTAPAIDTGTNYSTITFSSVSIGTAGNRWVIVGAGFRDNNANSFTSVNIDGNAMSEAVFRQHSTKFSGAGIYILYYPTGTTASIQLNTSNTASPGRMGIGVWAAYDLLSATPTQTTYDEGTDQSVVGSLTISSGGFGIGFNRIVGTGSGRTHSWSNMTERFDAVESGWAGHSGADTTTSNTYTDTISAAVDSYVGVWAAFR